jgi:hypothetical protein
MQTRQQELNVLKDVLIGKELYTAHIPRDIIDDTMKFLFYPWS